MSKLKACKHCGVEVAKGAKACPSCGGKLKMSMMMKLGILVVWIVVGSVVAGMNSEDGAQAKKSGTSSSSVSEAKAASQPRAAKYTISSKKLISEFESNEIAAVQKYKGQLLEISGTISAIEKSMFDEYYVSLESGMTMYSIPCYFDDPAILAKLKSGQQVKIMGVLTDTDAYQLEIKECELK